mgnify:FL=1|tara:strand:- start:1108 stop:1713 length:606 start_codon:yes stop_codon:yes gene_type:complete
MESKITDLKFRINKLVPSTACEFFINFYEENKDKSYSESSYKFKQEKVEKDNYKCINLSNLVKEDKKYVEPLEIAKKYINIMITNYVIHIKKNICPTFNNYLINKSDNIRILKYNKGQYIGDHSDINETTRASCTLNLNENYSGGEFRFFDGKIKEIFKTGDAIIFPAEPIWIHGTEPITKGSRYSINCFLHPHSYKEQHV